MKKIIALLLALLMCMLMCACSSKNNDTQGTSESASNTSVTESSTTETTTKSNNATTNMETEKGSIEYVGIEKANEGLVDEDNVVIAKFKFTNKQDDPLTYQSVFYINSYQNGVETKTVSYSSKGGEQYDLLQNQFVTVLKGGTIEFAILAKLKDDSPLTFIIGDRYDNNKKLTLEVSPKDGEINSSKTSDTTTASPSENSENTSTTKKVNTVKNIKIGDRIKTKNLEFTLNNIELIYTLNPKNTSGYYRAYPADDGKVYVHVDGTYLNKSKKDVCIRDLFIPIATYDKEYKYEGFVVVDDGDSNFTWGSSYVVCTPLSDCHYHGLIECPEIVDKTDKSLVVSFKINDTTYRCKVR